MSVNRRRRWRPPVNTQSRKHPKYLGKITCIQQTSWHQWANIKHDIIIDDEWLNASFNTIIIFVLLFILLLDLFIYLEILCYFRMLCIFNTIQTVNVFIRTILSPSNIQENMHFIRHENNNNIIWFFIIFERTQDDERVTHLLWNSRLTASLSSKNSRTLYEQYDL